METTLPSRYATLFSSCHGLLLHFLVLDIYLHATIYLI